MLQDIARELWWQPSRDLSDKAKHQLLERVARLEAFVAVMGLPAIWMFVAFLWGRVPSQALFTWGVMASLVGVFVARGAMLVLSKSDADDHHRQTRSLALLCFAAGTSIGSLTLFAMPSDPVWQTFVGLLILAVMSVNVVVASPVKLLFWSSQLSLIGVSLIGFLLVDTTLARSVAALLLYALPFGGSLARLNRGSAEGAVHFANRNEGLLEDLQSVNDELAHRAATDPLTGLANRDAFTAHLDLLTSAHNESGPDSVCVMFMDLDRFKAINDTLGHAAGDDLLQAVATRLRARLRPTDLLARIGGDELTITLPGIGSKDVARLTADRVLSAFDDPFLLAGERHHITASLGVAFGRTGTLSGEDLLRFADSALYAAKEAGRSRAVVYDETEQAALEERLLVQSEISEALSHGDIQPWWQPVVDLESGALVGAEGLARWLHPDGVRDAGTFIEPLTAAGLLEPLADQMLLHGTHLRTKIDSRNLKLGLNVTPSQITDLVMVELERGGLAGLVLEITERGVAQDLAAARHALEVARDHGAQVLLDDFGTGRSSLSLLAELPLDGVKIDRRFIATIEQPESRRVVADIVDIGRRHQLFLVAEGVETIEQLRIVREMGIPLAQGFLFSEALPAARFVALTEAAELPWQDAIKGSRSFEIVSA